MPVEKSLGSYSPVQFSRKLGQSIDPVRDYQQALLSKLGVDIAGTDKVLDVGCGDAKMATLLAETGAKVIGLDVHRDPNWRRVRTVDLLITSAFHIPFGTGEFDVIFAKDVLHHVAEHILDYRQATTYHRGVIQEIQRVTKPGGKIIIIEANRYNPIAYVHMTLMLGHKHFSRRYFRWLIESSFSSVRLGHAEARFFPIRNQFALKFIRRLESLFERIRAASQFVNYNFAIATNV